MSNVKASQHQIGINAVAAQNFTLTAEMGDGTLQLQRGVPGEYLQLLAEWDANGFGSVLTPPQFDDTQKIATAEFVQRALGNCSGYVSFSASAVLTAADAGKYVIMSLAAPGATLQLPDPSTMPLGTTFHIECTGYDLTVSAPNSTFAGPDVGFSGAQLTTRVSAFGMSSFTSLGPSYRVHGGSGKASLTSAGWQKLPSGLIIQWTTVTTNASGVSSFAFPIPFPSQTLKVFLTASGTNSVTTYGSGGSSSATINCFVGSTSAPKAENVQVMMLGY